jgi:hypothetical protein
MLNFANVISSGILFGMGFLVAENQGARHQPSASGAHGVRAAASF